MKAKQDALALKDFQQSQIAEGKARKKEEAEEDLAYNVRNMNLLQVFKCNIKSLTDLTEINRSKRPNSSNMPVQC